ncbi:MAG TPA: hypothetical protein VFK45_08030 [Gammaproteobacteria bacterium]|nr:hypothetical protein [Gammaproteobacteria bacterium]
MEAVSDINIELVRWRLDLAQARAALASANIANVHTAGYTARRLDFASQVERLRQGFEGNGAEAALREVRAEGFSPEPRLPQNLLGASVNLDDEIVQLVDAGARYRALTAMLNRHFGLMRLAISSRG